MALEKVKQFNETSLWELYAAGNNNALATLYTWHQKHLLLIAYKYLRCETNAEDIVADLFEKLLAMNTAERKTITAVLIHNPLAYLTVAIKNKSIDYLKIKHNRENIIINIRYWFTSKEKNTAYQQFTHDALELMLTRLEPREREIMQLHLAGYRNEEIANKLNLSYNNVKNNIYEARVKLKRIWKNIM
jgi:RNA polymerase sigma-70 factor (ECF subfamily)